MRISTCIAKNVMDGHVPLTVALSLISFFMKAYAKKLANIITDAIGSWSQTMMSQGEVERQIIFWLFPREGKQANKIRASRRTCRPWSHHACFMTVLPSSFNDACLHEMALDWQDTSVSRMLRTVDTSSSQAGFFTRQQMQSICDCILNVYSCRMGTKDVV